MSDPAGFEFRGGLPVKIESFASPFEKANWKIVRRDNYRSVEGFIVAANVESGDVTLSLKVPGADEAETKTESFGYDGIRIVRR